MGDLSQHFDSEEFACHCGCGAKTVNPTLIYLLEEIRARIGKPIHILSGVRCKKHNADVGGAPYSQHLLGNAADIQVKGLSSGQLHDIIENHFIVGGMGLYNTFVHIDVRTLKARWHG